MNRVQQWVAKVLGLQNPSAWSIRDWQRVLRGDVTGALSTDMLTRSGTVVSCASLIANALSSAELSVVRRIPSGGLESVAQSNASDALLTLTYDDKSAAFFGSLCLGNGWWYLDPSGSLYALDSWRTMAYVDDRQQVWVREGGGALVSYASIAHLKFQSQPRYVLAYNPAMLCSDSTLAALSITAMARAMAANAQSPGGIIEIPSALTAKGIENIKKSFREAHSGDAQGQTAVLEEGAKYNQLKPPSAVDSQMVEALQWSASSIAALYGVPNSLLNQTADVNKATANEEAKAFYTRALRPWAARASCVLGRLLLNDAERKSGLRIEFDLSSLQIGSGLEQIQYWREAVNSGIATSNEGRNAIGLPDQPDGDRLRVPVNMIFLDKLDQIPSGGANGGSPASAPV